MKDMKRIKIMLVSLAWLGVFLNQLGEASVSTNPPRDLRDLDYLLMLFVPVGGFILAQPERRWRFFLWYGMVAALPFSINVLAKTTDRVTYDDSGYAHAHVFFLWRPALMVFVGLSCVAVVAGLIGSDLMTFIKNRRQGCQPPAGG